MKRRLVGVVLYAGAAALLAATPACGPSLMSGDALQHSYPLTDSLPPVRPGAQWIWLDPVLHNVSSNSLTVQRIALSGVGLGTVVAVERIEYTVDNPNGARSVPGGRYVASPPVWFFAHTCRVQPLAAAPFTLRPGATSRILLVLRALRPGRLVVRNEVVYYRVGARSFRQVIPETLVQPVVTTAPVLRPASYEVPCLSLTTVLSQDPGHS